MIFSRFIKPDRTSNALRTIHSDITKVKQINTNIAQYILLWPVPFLAGSHISKFNHLIDHVVNEPTLIVFK